MNEIDPLELGRQLMRPSGETGKMVGVNMNISNHAIYDMAISMIDFKDDNIILEIGFGNGNFISKYFDINPNIKVFGVDYSDVLYNEATSINQKYIRSNRLNLRCEDSINASFDHDFFDTIITINTIYFWNPIEKQIEEIRRILKKGGKLLIGFSPKSIMEKLPFTKEVFTLFEKPEMIELLLKNNFKIIDEKMQNITKKSTIGHDINSINICIVAENNK